MSTANNKVSNLFDNFEVGRNNVKQTPLGEKKKDKQQNRCERKKYAALTFWLVVIYLVVVFIMIFFTGFKLMYLSDTVLLALLATSFAQVVGLFAFVMKYLFK